MATVPLLNLLIVKVHRVLLNHRLIFKYSSVIVLELRALSTFSDDYTEFFSVICQTSVNRNYMTYQ